MFHLYLLPSLTPSPALAILRLRQRQRVGAAVSTCRRRQRDITLSIMRHSCVLHGARAITWRPASFGRNFSLMSFEYQCFRCCAGPGMKLDRVGFVSIDREDYTCGLKGCILSYLSVQLNVFISVCLFLYICMHTVDTNIQIYAYATILAQITCAQTLAQFSLFQDYTFHYRLDIIRSNGVTL